MLEVAPAEAEDEEVVCACSDGENSAPLDPEYGVDGLDGIAVLEHSSDSQVPLQEASDGCGAAVFEDCTFDGSELVSTPRPRLPSICAIKSCI